MPTTPGCLAERSAQGQRELEDCDDCHQYHGENGRKCHRLSVRPKGLKQGFEDATIRRRGRRRMSECPAPDRGSVHIDVATVAVGWAAHTGRVHGWLSPER
jgi:hypothetical protein